MRALVGAIAAVAVVVVAVFAATGQLHLSQPASVRVPDTPTPWDFTTSVWDTAIGGDAALTADRYASLAAWADPGLGDQVSAVRAVATRVAIADLTGSDRQSAAGAEPDGLTPYWPASAPTAVQPTPPCAKVDILAASPAALPVTGSNPATLGMFARYAKTLLVYTGTCGATTYTQQSPAVTYVYAGQTSKHAWVPLRDWQVPVSATLAQHAAATEPYDWELEQFSGACTPTVVVRDRIVVVDAFEQMCAAAAQAGVHMSVTAGFRTRAEQATVFADAVRTYGSPEAARRYVAFADATQCTSKHCTGLALTIKPDADALAWLTRTVGCVDAAGKVTAGETCPAGETTVPNLARWGFAQPLAVSPGYLEFVQPLAASSSSSLAAPNCNPVGLPVANQVAAIFRCRLDRAGVVGTDQKRVVSEALTVSRCESGWNPTAAAFGGKFATAANPTTGKTYTQQGVFMLSTALADAGWVVGGRAAVSDPIANINAAASLWLATRGWEQFGCATGADRQGFEAGPVLPAFGGPQLPAWASTY